MAVPREKFNFAPLPVEIASPEDRAGKYSIDELQRMLEPLLVADARMGLQPETKWPAGYGLGVGVLISVGAMGCHRNWHSPSLALFNAFDLLEYSRRKLRTAVERFRSTPRR